MPTNVHRSGIAFGLCVIIASLSSGCASGPPVNRIPMAAEDLNYFRIDCSRKEEQIRMLQSMRQTGDERLAANFTNMVKPWTLFTDPEGYGTRAEIGSGEINKQINYNLQRLRYCR